MEAHHNHHQDKEAKQLASSPSLPSPSSSPSHEFSFTISLQSSSSSSTTTNNNPDKSKSLPPSSSPLAVDLSPADDIFFHGHLLPLHLLSHLSSSSPRFSTTSMDSFSLPNIRDFLEDEKSCGTSNRSNFTIDSITNGNYTEELDNKQRGMMTNEEIKSNKHSFSLFSSLTKGRKGCQILSSDHQNNKEDKEKQNKRNKVGFDMIHALKRYLRMVQQPLVHFRTGRRSEKNNIGMHNHGKAYSSSSGNLMRRNKPHELMRGRRGEFSAPASMRTSPTNSGLLLATTTTTTTTTLPHSAASDSTMEELQAAIQAAIAHCKNSIAKEDKLKCR